MKKVLFIIDSFPNYSETFLYNQIYFLLEKEVYVEVLAIKRKTYPKNILHGKMMKYKLHEKVEFSRHGINLRLLLNTLFYPVSSIKISFKFGLKKAFFLIQNIDIINRFRDFNVVHAHYGHIGALIGDLRSVGFFKNQKLICSFHGEELLPIHLDSYQSRYSNMLKFFDVITANSIYIKDLILSSLSGSEKIIKVLPESLDVGYFEPSVKKNNNQGCFSILFVGRLIEWKAPILAIQIVEKLLTLQHKVRLDIVGSGPEYEKCLGYILSKELDKNIKLHGPLSQEEIIELFKQSDVFLFPGIKEPFTSKAEAQGLVIQEAQAMEIPVIVSDVGGMKYGLIDGKTGFVVPENNLDRFVETIEELLFNPKLKSELGKNGRRFVLENFDSQVIGEKLLEFYE